MKEYLRMLKKLILIFFAAQVAQAVLSHRKKAAEKQPPVEVQPPETAYPSISTETTYPTATAETDPEARSEQE